MFSENLALTMSTKNILQSSLFRGNKCQVNLGDFSGIHLFNCGKSAYLIKNEELYLIKESVEEKVSTFHSNQVPFGFGCGSNANIIRPELTSYVGNGIKGIATGAEHTVVLDYDGHVYCSGSNSVGQLGTGLCCPIKQPYKTNLKDIDKISCGRTFTIALSKCDELWFWGQLSLILNNERITYMTPTLIELPGDPIPKFISTGENHIAVMDKERKIYTWGNNEYGQLGHGHRNIVRQPELLSIDTNADDPVGFVIALCGKRSTIFVTEEGMLGICDESTNNTVQFITDLSFRIVTLATHWNSDFITVTDICGFYYVCRKIVDSKLLMRVAYEDIAEGFVDIGTPQVQHLSEKSSTGIRRIDHKTGGDLDRCAGHIDVAHLYNSENYSDIQIKLSDGVLYAHKLILTKQSLNLRNIISESNSEINILDMSNMNATAYRTYIKFLYTGLVDLQTIENIPVWE
ncbi:RCC1 and BTB domain-containing protein 2-like isoform X2 [Rhodnius prolixus]|uniref:RCC1 and BTB domain-containing protein 2-like isoform X2 n=1 Tax=Rhodnius prolixus TaxID=13249 RepID=UPI003D18DC6A